MAARNIVPYRVLVIDDQIGVSSFGATAKATLELDEFVVVHVHSYADALVALEKQDFDLFIIDLNLQTSEDGDQVLKHLRRAQYRQPIILATAEPGHLDKPIREYAEVLASGPVTFFHKNDENIELTRVVRDVAGRVDSLRRALRLMNEAGMGEQAITVDNRTITVRELLRPNDDMVAVERALKESLDTLLLRVATKKK